ncbi:adhesion G protein-coupled receptor G3-like protein [Lates japonicus]|uniref:Adhesion G protein-coupled receptor G3-like protein n=1 Tax=Lates japonicus TaxID=270547 RepID=A0AAD3NGJ4_LATJO|nr:adhesion G protein-coupled receptor G3-like protein [Lates japonicus]
MLFSGMFLRNIICQSSGLEEPNLKLTIDNNGRKTCVSCKPPGKKPDISLSPVWSNNDSDVSPDTAVNVMNTLSSLLEKNTTIILENKEILSKQDIVVMPEPDHNFSCIPSKFYSGTGFFLTIDNCLNVGVRNTRVSQVDLCGNHLSYDKHACKGLEEPNLKLTIDNNGRKTCVSCKPPGKKPDISLSPVWSNNDSDVSPDTAVNVMNTLSSLLEKMGNYSTAAITMGDIKGLLTKLPSKNHSDIKNGITTSGDMRVAVCHDL